MKFAVDYFCLIRVDKEHAGDCEDSEEEQQGEQRQNTTQSDYNSGVFIGLKRTHPSSRHPLLVHPR